MGCCASKGRITGAGAGASAQADAELDPPGIDALLLEDFVVAFNGSADQRPFLRSAARRLATARARGQSDEAFVSARTTMLALSRCANSEIKAAALQAFCELISLHDPVTERTAEGCIPVMLDMGERLASGFAGEVTSVQLCLAEALSCAVECVLLHYAAGSVSKLPAESRSRLLQHVSAVRALLRDDDSRGTQTRFYLECALEAGRRIVDDQTDFARLAVRVRHVLRAALALGAKDIAAAFGELRALARSVQEQRKAAWYEQVLLLRGAGAEATSAANEVEAHSDWIALDATSDDWHVTVQAILNARRALMRMAPGASSKAGASGEALVPALLHVLGSIAAALDAPVAHTRAYARDALGELARTGSDSALPSATLAAATHWLAHARLQDASEAVDVEAGPGPAGVDWDEVLTVPPHVARRLAALCSSADGAAAASRVVSFSCAGLQAGKLTRKDLARLATTSASSEDECWSSESPSHGSGAVEEDSDDGPGAGVGAAAGGGKGGAQLRYYVVTASLAAARPSAGAKTAPGTVASGSDVVVRKIKREVSGRTGVTYKIAHTWRGHLDVRLQGAERGGLFALVFGDARGGRYRLLLGSESEARSFMRCIRASAARRGFS